MSLLIKNLQIIELNDAAGRLIEPEWLLAAENVHRQLRPQLPTDYVTRLSEIFAGGARMSLALENEGVFGVALWRIVENTYEGRRFYIDDLVCDEARRGQGVGQFLLAHLEQTARAHHCAVFTLDSGVQRSGAHHFYFREGMHIPAFCFRKVLS